MQDDPAIVRMQLDAVRKMTPEERLRIAVELTAAVESLALAGIRADYPNASGSDY